MACSLCRKQTLPEYDPFCSPYCRNQDLLNWMNEDYKIPAPLDEHQLEDLLESENLD